VKKGAFDWKSCMVMRELLEEASNRFTRYPSRI
jgi:hypothetical protein